MYLINRLQDTDRLAKASLRAAEAGIIFTRKEAVVVAGNGYLGNLLSHRQCVLHARREHLNEAWIMEDDVAFRSWHFFPVLKHALARTEWDLFYPYQWSNTLDACPAGVCLEPIDGTLCTHLWAIHSRFFEQFLDRLDDWIGSIDRIFIGDRSVRQYASSYNLVGQDAGVSAIDGKFKPLRWHK